MAITERNGEALQWAEELHRNQRRKGKQVPYISHLISVSALVWENGGSEDQAIAALLHDAIADQLRADFAALGYPLHTNGNEQSAPALIQCYPHVALLALLKRNYRVPYKVSRSGQYWKADQLSRRERIERLLEQFRAIKAGLGEHINAIPDLIPAPSEVTTLASLKPVEDMLGGLLCAWIGIEQLEGRTVGLWDDTAAIWVPKALINS